MGLVFKVAEYFPLNKNVSIFKSSFYFTSLFFIQGVSKYHFCSGIVYIAQEQNSENRFSARWRTPFLIQSLNRNYIILH